MRRAIALAAIVVTLASVVPATGFALTSWYGANYSYDSNSKQSIYVCDAESDNNGAYSLDSQSYPNTNQIRTNDGNGSASGCGYRLTQPYVIWRHRTCEDQALQPDPCGTWVHP